jgi:hypothetical protein
MSAIGDIICGMTEVTQISSRFESGEPQAASDLLPIAYDALRRLAAEKLGRENPGQTLQPTALVHEAYLRLANTDQNRQWQRRTHFFRLKPGLQRAISNRTRRVLRNCVASLEYRL